MQAMTIKGLPNDVCEALAIRAKLHRRSPVAEAKMILVETMRMWSINSSDVPNRLKRLRGPVTTEQIVRIIRSHRDGQPYTGGPLTTDD
jgi:hypothetical protein